MPKIYPALFKEALIVPDTFPVTERAERLAAYTCVLNLRFILHDTSLARIRMCCNSDRQRSIFTTLQLHPLLGMAFRQAFQEPEEEIIIFFDYVNEATPSVQLMILSLLQHRALYGWDIPDNVHMVPIFRSEDPQQKPTALLA